MANYRRVLIDLSVPGSRLPIDNVNRDSFRNTSIDFVTVISAPSGSGMFLHFGDGADEWDLPAPGTTFELCPPENTGLFYTLPQAGGGQVVLEVSFTGVSPVVP